MEVTEIKEGDPHYIEAWKWDHKKTGGPYYSYFKMSFRCIPPEVMEDAEKELKDKGYHILHTINTSAGSADCFLVYLMKKGDYL